MSCPRRRSLPPTSRGGRSRLKSLELAERGPSIAPPLPLPEPADQEGQGSPAHPRTVAERAERCQTLSTALLGASVLHPADAADLRGEYHAAMLEVLREHQESSPCDPQEPKLDRTKLWLQESPPLRRGVAGT
jgi:hypothetical protein